MKTIILCGGLGTRLKEETEFKPKPMVYVGKKPIIWHIMKIYAYFGYNEFVLALGYKADYIKDFFLNQKAFTHDFTLTTKNHKAVYYDLDFSQVENFKITFVDTGIDTLPGERILRCQKYIPKKDKYFMVTYGDVVSDIDIRQLVKFHQKQKKVGTITCVHPRTKYGLVKIADDFQIKSFQEKPVLSDWVNGGFMVFDKRIFQYLKQGETEHPALSRLSKLGELSAFKHESFWFAVDTHKELDELNKIWMTNKAPWKVWK